jgi:translation initiation factor IF-2
MPETAEKKKKIYRLATELNLASETIIEFLKKKGFAVKSHMSSVDDEMLREILVHFKKEKDVAERHHRKLHELRETRKKPEKKVAEKPSEEVTPRHAVPPQIVEEKRAPEVAEVVQERVEEVKPAPVEVPAVEPEKPPEVPAPVEEKPPVPTVVEAKAPAPSELPPEEKIETPVEAVRRAKVGLKIKGKMALEAPQAEVEVKGEEKPAAEQVLPVELEEAKKKKKRKKRVREGTKLVGFEDADELLKKKKKKKKLRHHEVDEREVDDAIRRTFQMMDETAVSARAVFRRRKKRERLEEEQRMLEAVEKEKKVLRVTEFVAVNEMANLMHVPASEVIKKCIELGLMVSINQRLDKDTITLVADEFGFDVQFEDIFAAEVLADLPDPVTSLKPRPPVVTIMGHVDHGKTSLLDYIRQSNVVAGESGGITQHIGAYEVSLDHNKQITFLDTPGHEAFTAMRARGAQVTDIVVLVVAADDSVMPQTLEAISHAQAANVPIVIAINKIDKPDANPDRIKQQLAEKGILVEEWGGKYQCVELSARTGKNVDLLLEKVLVEAELLDLKANPDRRARGAVIESKLDKGKGIVGTVLVQKGSLKLGDSFIAGVCSGRVRAMFDERGNRVEVARPSTPVQVIGFDGIPQAGDEFVVLSTDHEAREISFKRQQLKREQDFRQARRVTLDTLSQEIKEGQVRELKVIVKGDVDGSVEALSDSLMKLSNPEVRVTVLHRGVGAISESDVLLAAASDAVIIGFHVRPNLNARRLAEQEQVDIRLYSIIYDAIKEVRDALEGLLEPERKEEVVATVEVRETFKVSKIGTVAGCYVQEGKIARNSKVRLVRDGVVMFEGAIASLKRFKEDVREVEAGFECGIALQNYNDIKVGDTIEAYKTVEMKRKL